MEAGRWRYRAALWERLVALGTLTADADPQTAGLWAVYDLATVEAHAPVATLSTAGLLDLQAAGVTIVYRY